VYEATPAGPQSTKYNDWDEVVPECRNGARYMAGHPRSDMSTMNVKDNKNEPIDSTRLAMSMLSTSIFTNNTNVFYLSTTNNCGTRHSSTTGTPSPDPYTISGKNK
jgi:hypothetical protein